MAHSKCYSFEASGHRYRPLDGIAGVVVRLYCPRCGRVIPADEAYNTAMWGKVDLPADVRAEVGGPDEPIH